MPKLGSSKYLLSALTNLEEAVHKSRRSCGFANLLLALFGVFGSFQSPGLAQIFTLSESDVLNPKSYFSFANLLCASNLLRQVIINL